MIVLNVLLWLLIGSVTGFLYFTFQQWSVNQLDPQKSARSIRLIVGGAYLRWLFFGIVLAFSTKDSYLSLFCFFIAFLITRFTFLLKWQGLLGLKSLFIRQS